MLFTLPHWQPPSPTRMTLNESTWIISWGNLRIGSRHKYNNMYLLMVINPEVVVNVAKKTDPNLWHNRLGHMSQAGLDRLMAVDYIPKIQAKTDFCEHFWYGKQTRSPHSLHYEMVQNPLELIHSDICRMMPERSLGGSRYFITFADDCTRKVWAYSVRSKDKVLTIFSQWLAEVESRTGQRVKTLQSNNWGE